MRRLGLAWLMAGCLALEAAPASKVFPLAYDQHDFPNGLRLVTVPTDFPNVVAVYIVVRTGSRNEVEPGKTGFAHFFEHMMFRGTKNVSPDQYEAILKNAGASSNAYTSDDLTTYHTTFSKEDLETILKVEADRFQNLEYGPDAFKTEALAVLGEYNKNSASPTLRIMEAMREKAYQRHTYGHTTMGYLKDIQDMPNQYEYSKQFFDRYYRPEYTTIIVCGDVDTTRTRAMVEKYWGQWKRGSYKSEVPQEPPQTEGKRAEVKWPTQTLPWVVVGQRAAAYSDTEKDNAALDLLSFLGFSENSDLYQRLVVQQQKVDMIAASNPDNIDPGMFTVYSRVKKAEDMKMVEEQILSTLAGFKDTLIAPEKLAAVKKRLRYQFAMGLDNSEAIAGMLARYIALRRTPETINKVYELYDSLTPEDLRQAARKYFTDTGRTVVTLTGGSK